MHSNKSPKKTKMKTEWNLSWQNFLCGLQKDVYTELDLQLPVPLSLPAPSHPSLCPAEQGNGFLPAQRGPGWSCRLLQAHGDPRTPSRAAWADPAGGTPHCHGDWVGSAALQQPTSCLILPAHTPGVGLGTHHFFETNLLAVVPGFCAQRQIEPEIQGISKLNLHPVAGSGSCCSSEVKETICCYKIKQCFNVLPLKIFKSNV